MNNDKYEDLDKQITKEIMSEIKGQVIDIVCPHCKGKNSECEDCKGEGHYLMQY